MATTVAARSNSMGHQGKLSKSRARHSVKPILKKLHSTHTEKNSLDLDRGWDEQTVQLGYFMTDNINEYYYDGQGQNVSPGSGYLGSSTSYPFPHTTRDVSFTHAANDFPKVTLINTTTTTNSASTTCASTSTCNNLSHARSTSGASHISISTSNSVRNGSFVHPFQQTPRTSTPPLVSYAGSLASLDQSSSGGSGSGSTTQPSTIAENEDDALDPLTCPMPSPNPNLNHNTNRKPSLTFNQRTPSATSNPAPPLRVVTSRTTSGTASRFVQTGSSANQARYSDAQLSVTPAVAILDDSPISPTSMTFSSPTVQSPTSATTTIPMSPARSSLDMHHFRIRSRSDVDAHTRQEQIREARRKFEEKQKAKEEKYQREQVRKREREDNKEAQRQAASVRKGSYSRTSSSIDLHLRPAITRKSTATSRLSVQAERQTMPEFASCGYEDMDESPPARANNVHFESYKNNRISTKRRTSGSWTAFMLWFRTRLLKLGRR